MKYLLDTHAFIWLSALPESLSETVRQYVVSPDNELLISAVSGWEAALLWKLQRIELPEDPIFFIPRAIHALSLIPIAINFETAITAATLPLIHRDPFDRLLIAAAMQQQIAVLSKDRILAEYGVKVIW